MSGIASALSSMQFATWSSSTSYTAGTVVQASNDKTYIALTSSRGSDPSKQSFTTKNPSWQLLGSSTLAPTGQAWKSNCAYTTGHIATYKGTTYVCTAPTSGTCITPDCDDRTWDVFVSGVFCSPLEWTEKASLYCRPGDTISFKGSTYVCSAPKPCMTTIGVTPDCDDRFSLLCGGLNVASPPWGHGVKYRIGDLLTHQSCSYVCISPCGPVVHGHGSAMDTPPPHANKKCWRLFCDSAIKPAGVWSSVQACTYVPGSLVSYAGGSWLLTTPLAASSYGTAPPMLPSSWQQIAAAGSGLVPSGPWSTSTTYLFNHVVTHGGTSYVARTLVPSGGQPPSSNPTAWQVLSQGIDVASASSEFVGGAAYVVGTLASYKGGVYLCTQAQASGNTANSPIAPAWVSLSRGGCGGATTPAIPGATGPIGPSGPTGPVGPAGKDGVTGVAGGNRTFLFGNGYYLSGVNADGTPTAAADPIGYNGIVVPSGWYAPKNTIDVALAQDARFNDPSNARFYLWRAVGIVTGTQTDPITGAVTNTTTRHDDYSPTYFQLLPSDYDVGRGNGCFFWDAATLAMTFPGIVANSWTLLNGQTSIDNGYYWPTFVSQYTLSAVPTAPKQPAAFSMSSTDGKGLTFAPAATKTSTGICVLSLSGPYVYRGNYDATVSRNTQDTGFTYARNYQFGDVVSTKIGNVPGTYCYTATQPLSNYSFGASYVWQIADLSMMSNYWKLLASFGTNGTNGTNGINGVDGKSLVTRGEYSPLGWTSSIGTSGMVSWSYVANYVLGDVVHFGGGVAPGAYAFAPSTPLDSQSFAPDISFPDPALAPSIWKLVTLDGKAGAPGLPGSMGMQGEPGKSWLPRGSYDSAIAPVSPGSTFYNYVANYAISDVVYSPGVGSYVCISPLNLISFNDGPPIVTTPASQPLVWQLLVASPDTSQFFTDGGNAFHSANRDVKVGASDEARSVALVNNGIEGVSVDSTGKATMGVAQVNQSLLTQGPVEFQDNDAKTGVINAAIPLNINAGLQLAQSVLSQDTRLVCDNSSTTTVVLGDLGAVQALTLPSSGDIVPPTAGKTYVVIVASSPDNINGPQCTLKIAPESPDWLNLGGGQNGQSKLLNLPRGSTCICTYLQRGEWSVLRSSQLQFQKVWNAQTNYTHGDMVRYNNGLFVWCGGSAVSALGIAPIGTGLDAMSKWAPMATSTHRGSYQDNVMYQPFDLVSSGNQTWMALEAVNGKPSGDNVGWQLYAPGIQPRNFDKRQFQVGSTTTYEINDVLEHQGVTYLSTQFQKTSNSTPAPNTTSSTFKVLSHGINALAVRNDVAPVWSSVKSYIVGERVLHETGTYECIQAVVYNNNAPLEIHSIVNPSTQFWKLLDAHTTWLSNVNYNLTSVVVYHGNTYVSTRDGNIGNVPQRMGTVTGNNMAWVALTSVPNWVIGTNQPKGGNLSDPSIIPSRLGDNCFKYGCVYGAGDVVSYQNDLWMSSVDRNGQVPGSVPALTSETTQWIRLTGGTYVGEWSQAAGRTYAPHDQVTYKGAIYTAQRTIINNSNAGQNYPPDVTPVLWSRASATPYLLQGGNFVTGSNLSIGSTNTKPVDLISGGEAYVSIGNGLVSFNKATTLKMLQVSPAEITVNNAQENFLTSLHTNTFLTATTPGCIVMLPPVSVAASLQLLSVKGEFAITVSPVLGNKLASANGGLSVASLQVPVGGMCMLTNDGVDTWFALVSGNNTSSQVGNGVSDASRQVTATPVTSGDSLDAADVTFAHLATGLVAVTSGGTLTINPTGGVSGLTYDFTVYNHSSSVVMIGAGSSLSIPVPIPNIAAGKSQRYQLQFRDANNATLYA